VENILKDAPLSIWADLGAPFS